jgi:DNA invertase Pin-like site-specific DNA recombinase
MITDRAPPARRSTVSLDGIDTASLQRIVDIDPVALQKIVMAIAAAQKTLRSKRSLTGLAAARRRGQKLGRPRAMNDTEIALARRMMIDGATRKARKAQSNPSS